MQDRGSISIKTRPTVKGRCEKDSVVIEKTSKALKRQRLYAWALLFIGAALVISRAPVFKLPGAFATLGAAIWLGVLRIRTWWHHG